MNKKQFEETILYEELAKTDDTEKIMLKSHLSCLLNGGKIRETACLYSVGRILNPIEKESVIRNRENHIIGLFEEIKRNKRWGIKIEKWRYYDENGEELPFKASEIYLDTEITISRLVKTTEETTYYLDDSLDIVTEPQPESMVVAKPLNKIKENKQP